LKVGEMALLDADVDLLCGVDWLPFLGHLAEEKKVSVLLLTFQPSFTCH
jgi:hypothetical protein